MNVLGATLVRYCSMFGTPFSILKLMASVFFKEIDAPRLLVNHHVLQNQKSMAFPQAYQTLKSISFLDKVGKSFIAQFNNNLIQEIKYISLIMLTN